MQENPDGFDGVGLGGGLVLPVPLQPGEMMIYNYDFGDNWEFVLLLERIDPIDSKIKKPKVIASHGKAPQQYHNWDTCF